MNSSHTSQVVSNRLQGMLGRYGIFLPTFFMVAFLSVQVFIVVQLGQWNLSASSSCRENNKLGTSTSSREAREVLPRETTEAVLSPIGHYRRAKPNLFQGQQQQQSGNNNNNNTTPTTKPSWPKLEDIVVDVTNKNGKKRKEIISDPQFLLDFAIVGFEKCGTSTLMEWLGASPAVKCFQEEIYDLYTNETGTLAWRMYTQFPHGYEYKRGYKSPIDIFNANALHMLDKYFPQTRLIVALRHPVLYVSLHKHWVVHLQQPKRYRMVWTVIFSGRF